MDERRIEAEADGRIVPGRLYVPDDHDAPGVLLLGHGGGGSKDSERFVALGRHFATRTGLAVLCIDGPMHGERAPNSGDRTEDFRAVRRAVGSRWAAEQMAEDWPAAAAAACDLVDCESAIAYVGFSMGTMFGVPTVAAMPSIRAAVFGVGGVPRAAGVTDLIRNVSGERAAAIAAEEERHDERGSYLLDAAARLGHSHVLMINTTKDEVFPRDGVHRLFDAVAAKSKRLFYWEGDHLGLPAESVRLAVDFLRNACGLDAAGPFRRATHDAARG